ncbi:MAG: immunity 52 family protein [Pseudomonadota bacterium]
MKHAYEILISFINSGDLQVRKILTDILSLAKAVQPLSPNLSADRWLLAGDTKQEALLYKVFENAQPTAAAIAVLETKLKEKVDPRMVTIWNGEDGHKGASISFMGRPAPGMSVVTLVGRPESFSHNWRLVAELLMAGTDIWPARYITVESNGYFAHKTFKDRPGVGWMLYLPQVLSVCQVPEAGALVPVLGRDKKQIGTIIVSITDVPFSDDIPEHVKVANAIEIRLADQDLLPRYAGR